MSESDTILKTSINGNFAGFEARYLTSLNGAKPYAVQLIAAQLNRLISDYQCSSPNGLSDEDRGSLKDLVVKMNIALKSKRQNSPEYVIVENPLSVRLECFDLEVFEEYHFKIKPSIGDETLCDELNFLIANLVRSESLVQKKLKELIKKLNNRDSIKSQKQKFIVEKDNDQFRVKLVPRSWRDHADKVIAGTLVSGLATGLGLYFGASGFSLFGAGTASATAFTVGSVGVSFGVLSAAITGVGAGLAIAAVCVCAYHYYEKGNTNTFSVDDQSIDDDSGSDINPTDFEDNSNRLPVSYGTTILGLPNTPIADNSREAKSADHKYPF